MKGGNLNLDYIKLRRIGQKYIPKGVGIHVIDSKQYACADYEENAIYFHCVHTDDDLIEFLHECAHFILNHKNRKVPQWRREYEAEMWALETANKEGVFASYDYLDDAAERVKQLYRKYFNRYKSKWRSTDDMAFAYMLESRLL